MLSYNRFLRANLLRIAGAPQFLGQSNGPPQQPLIHHPEVLPISAVFRLRYVNLLLRKWAALGT
jgi:hypothetical protein